MESSHHGTVSESSSEAEAVVEIAKRTIVRAKRGVTHTQIAKKVPVTKSKEDSEDEMVIDTKPKKAKKSILEVKVGQKRKTAPEPIESLTQPAGRRVKKLADGKEQAIPQAPVVVKKVVKKPVVFKLGKWNPDTVLLDESEEIERHSNAKTPIFNCCISCNARNVIRAVETNNADLFKKLILDKDHIHSLQTSWGPESKGTAMDHIMATGNKTLLELLCKVPGAKKTDAQIFHSAVTKFYLVDRVQLRPYLLHTIHTGKVDFKAYHAGVR